MIEVAGILLAIVILVTLPFWLRLGEHGKGWEVAGGLRWCRQIGWHCRPPRRPHFAMLSNGSDSVIGLSAQEHDGSILRSLFILSLGGASMMMDRDMRIRRRAYEIWEREGRPHGREQDHWHQARREVNGEGRGDFDNKDDLAGRSVAAARMPRPDDGRSAGVAGIGAGGTASGAQPGGVIRSAEAGASQAGGTGGGTAAGAASGSAKRSGV
jgi:hypothetical protein